jgi:hypothetical protein
MTFPGTILTAHHQSDLLLRWGIGMKSFAIWLIFMSTKWSGQSSNNSYVIWNSQFILFDVFEFLFFIHLVKIPMVVSLEANGGQQCTWWGFLFRAHKWCSLFVCLQNNIYYLTLIQLFLHTVMCLCVGLFLYEYMSVFDSVCVSVCLSHTHTSKNTLWLHFLLMYALAHLLLFTLVETSHCSCCLC